LSVGLGAATIKGNNLRLTRRPIAANGSNVPLVRRDAGVGICAAQTDGRDKVEPGGAGRYSIVIIYSIVLSSPVFYSII
jgi:hypothetical protein